jgi:hypothetical protein
MEIINFKPPPTIKAFIKDYIPGELFYSWIVGPVGSAKTTALFFKLVYMAGLQQPDPDGIRRTRAVVVRNTAPMLRDTTLVSWNRWFQDGVAGDWLATPKVFILRFGDVECEVLFRALDTPADVAKVLSLEVTFVIIDEFVEMVKQVIDGLSARCGRWRSPGGAPATNWGMWGASNPSVEDNWWFDYLHNNDADLGNPVQKIDIHEDQQLARERLIAAGLLDAEANAKYYLQPSGFAPDAENVDNLPGKRDYYTNQAKGKSEAWIKQYLEAEWGYSIAGKAVVPTFKDKHISRTRLKFNPHLPLVAGFDPGLAGCAFILGQLTLEGQLLILGEIVKQGVGTKRLIKDFIKPYLRNFFPNARLIVAPDPAAASRSSNDERTIVATLRGWIGHENVRIETNNRLPKRLDALEHFTTNDTEDGPGMLVDARMCPMVVRALKGGWRYSMDIDKDVLKDAEPEKNAYSHPGDGAGYLARYFYRQFERNERYGVGSSVKPFVPPRFSGASYHVR